jgi:hypothetical protein
LTLETLLLLLWLQACAQFYKVEPEFVKAVADVECNMIKGFKTGPIDKRGKYIGPMGIHKDFERTYDIRNPYTNIALGCRALARSKDRKKALRKYNKEFNMAYYNSVMRRYGFYKKEGLR